VRADASRLPGAGETVTAPSCSAEASRRAGAHDGEPAACVAAGHAAVRQRLAPAPSTRARKFDIDS